MPSTRTKLMNLIFERLLTEKTQQHSSKTVKYRIHLQKRYSKKLMMRTQKWQISYLKCTIYVEGISSIEFLDYILTEKPLKHRRYFKAALLSMKRRAALFPIRFLFAG